MRCLSPRSVCFRADGKTISFSEKEFSKEYAPFKLPCGKCLECRLEYARQWAVRCIHEAKMHENNCFITLTYDDKHLTSPKLHYPDFQKFMKRLRFAYPNQEISMFVTGEYGEKEKRPHWHAIVFNWAPTDLIPHYISKRGDQVYKSDTLTRLWQKGHCDIGSVTMESAGYVARYAAKKLCHGDDGHDYEPISKKSSKRAIGKKFLESYYKDIFNYGHVILEDGVKVSIPRYYEKWLLKNDPILYQNYIKIKLERSANAAIKNEKDKRDSIIADIKRLKRRNFRSQITKAEQRTKIINQKFKELQKHLKGDI